MQKAVTVIAKIEAFIFFIALILLPIFFFPWSTSPFDTPKLFVTSFAFGLIIFLCLVKMVIRGSYTFEHTSFDIPVILLALVYLVSAILRTPNKTEAFFQPGTATVFILGAIIFFTANSLFARRKSYLTASLLLSGVLVSLVSLLLATGVVTNIPFLPAFLKNISFSTFGGKLPEAIFYATILPLGIGLLIEEKTLVKKVFYGASLGVITLSLVLAVYRVLPGKPTSPILPSYQVSWSIAVDTIKESPLLGIGPGNYLSAFGRFKPVTINSTNIWGYNFNTSKSFFLTNLTETGLLGFAILLFLFYQLYKTIKKDPAFVSLGVLTVALILFPGYLTSILTFFILLSIISVGRETSLNLKIASDSPTASRIPAVILGVIGATLLGVVFFFGTKLALAEYNFYRAVVAVSQNNAQGAYDAITRTISFNPLVDRYRSLLAQMDISLASSIAQKKDLTEADRGNITQLIQEAIAEGKSAVALNPQRAVNWENLGNIYRSIMPFAQGADSFTVQTLSQAVALEPVNPNLRVSLGGVYYALGNYDDAIDSFQLATLAKPDFANAHYNLSAAYREKGDIEKAISEINIVLSLVQKDSNDYNIAKTELDELNKRLPAKKETATGESLVPPQPAPEQIIKPPLELPEEATPPATP